MSQTFWYLEQAGVQSAPMTHDAVAELIRSGQLAPGSRAWRAGMASWQPWETLPELAALAGPPPLDAPTPIASAPPPPGWGAPPSATGGVPPFPQDSYAADAFRAPAGVRLYPKAPLGARFVASLIDGVVGSLPAIILIGGVIGAAAAEATGAAIALGLLALAATLWALYYAFTKDGRPGGQSIGKKAMGLMVIHLPTNQPCNNGQSALRYLVLFGTNLIPYVGWLVEPIATLAAEGGRRLGDNAAGTQVIEASAYKAR